MAIKIAIIQKLVMETPMLLETQEFDDKAKALQWVNAQANSWIVKGETSSKKFGGQFIIDGLSSRQIVVFNSLTDELFISANDGEELWMACLPEDNIAELNDQGNS